MENKYYFIISIIAIIAIVGMVVSSSLKNSVSVSESPISVPSVELNQDNSDNVAGQAYKIQSTLVNYEGYAVDEISDYAIKNNLDKDDYIFYRHSTQGQLTPGKIESYSNEKYALVFTDKTNIGKGNNLFTSNEALLINLDNGVAEQLALEACDVLERESGDLHLLKIEDDGTKVWVMV